MLRFEFDLKMERCSTTFRPWRFPLLRSPKCRPKDNPHPLSNRLPANCWPRSLRAGQSPTNEASENRRMWCIDRTSTLSQIDSIDCSWRKLMPFYVFCNQILHVKIFISTTYFSLCEQLEADFCWTSGPSLKQYHLLHHLFITVCYHWIIVDLKTSNNLIAHQII